MNISRKGFTLLELLAVVSIIITLVGLLIIGSVEARKKARSTRAKEEANELVKAWKTYWTVYGKWPPSWGADPGDKSMGTAELSILMGGSAPGDPDNPQNINFLDLGTNSVTSKFIDPWGKAYKVKFSVSSGLLGESPCETIVSFPNRRRYENAKTP